MGLGPTPDSTYGPGGRQKSNAEHPDGSGADGHDPSDPQDPADQRLIIEEDQSGDAPVYTTLDGRTGAVVQKLPGEQVLRLARAETYVAGQLVKTSA